MTARSAGGRPAGVVPPREARGSVLPMLGRLRRPGFQRLEEPTGPASNPWKPGQIPCTAGQDRGWCSSNQVRISRRSLDHLRFPLLSTIAHGAFDNALHT